MESEAMPSPSRPQHISSLSGQSDGVVSTVPTVNSQPTSLPEARIPPTNPTEIAGLWSSVFDLVGSLEYQDFPTESSSSYPESLGPPTMNSFQKPLEAGRLNEPPRRPGPKTKHTFSAHGQNANIASMKANEKPMKMPCKIEYGVRTLGSAHDYFCLKLGELSAVGLNTPQWTNTFGRDAMFFQVVTDEYKLLRVCCSSRTAFSQLTMDRFFDLDSLCRALPTQGQAKFVKMNTSATNIKDAEWRELPNWGCQSSKVASPFACTFWLSIQTFPEDLHQYLDDYTFVLGTAMALPYLTVDFQKEDERFDETRKRATCTGMQALFNRHHMYMETHQGIPAATGKRDYPFCCHFMVIFDEAKYEGWEITANKDGDWTDESCTMTRIFQSRLFSAGSVKDLYTWIGEIHCWGATKYGPACMDEIRAFLTSSSLKQTPVGEMVAGEDQPGA